jgi:hypothetical protein
VKVVTDQNGLHCIFTFRYPLSKEKNVGVRYMQHRDLCFSQTGLSDFTVYPWNHWKHPKKEHCVTWNLEDESKWLKPPM